MKMQIVLLTSFLFSSVWSENTDFHGEDLIDPFDMLHYDAAAKKMRSSKQMKIITVLKQYLRTTLENAEKHTQHTTDEDVQYYAEITFSNQILRDFLKCIKESDCDPTILEKHLQNIQFRFKTDDDNSELTSEGTFSMIFDRILEVAILLLILVVFLDLVKDFTLSDWLVCIITLVCKSYWACDFKILPAFLNQCEQPIEDISVIICVIVLKETVTLTLKCFRKNCHKKQNLERQTCLPCLEDMELCYSVQEVPIAHVHDEPGVECNQELSSSPSLERPKGKLKSITDAFKNSNEDRKQLLEQRKGLEDYISSTAVPKLLDNDHQQTTEELSDSFRETSCSTEQLSGSLSFIIIEEQNDS